MLQNGSNEPCAEILAREPEPRVAFRLVLGAPCLEFQSRLAKLEEEKSLDRFRGLHSRRLDSSTSQQAAKEFRTFIVQPVFKEFLVAEVKSAMGGTATFQGMRFKYSLDEVRELRVPRRDQEFLVTVVGSENHARETSS
jgi:hypothetical protein